MTAKNTIKDIDYSKIVDPGVSSLFYQEMTNKIISYIQNNNFATFQEIISKVGGGERRVIRLLDQMVNLGLLEFKSSKFILYGLMTNYPIRISDVECAACESMTVDIDGKMKPLLHFMKAVINDRPKSTFIFDQRPVNVETVIRRVAYAIRRGDIQNKRIAIIGDDDLTSIAIARTDMAKEIVVFDIDDRITSLIRKLSKMHKLNIKTVQQDLLKDLPSEFTNYFDTFITDPTPTVKPLTLFTNRGLQMLKREQGKIGYISLYPSHMGFNADFQKKLGRMNLLITDVLPFFNQYEIIYHTLTDHDIELMKKYNAYQTSISFFESLMRIETTSSSKEISTKYSQGDLLGKATKQVLKDSKKDPVLSDKSGSEFIRKSAENLSKMLKDSKK